MLEEERVVWLCGCSCVEQWYVSLYNPDEIYAQFCTRETGKCCNLTAILMFSFLGSAEISSLKIIAVL